MLKIDIGTTHSAYFLNCIFRKSALGLFVLPNFRQKGYGSKIKFNKDFRAYYENCMPLIDSIRERLVKNFVSNTLFESKYSHAMDIYIFEMNRNFRQIAEERGALSEWTYPDLPEDLSLFDEQGECILYSQTHEEKCIYFGETDREAELFSAWGVRFIRFEETEEDRKPYRLKGVIL